MDLFFLGHHHSFNSWIERRAKAVRTEQARRRRTRRPKRAARPEGVVWAKDEAARESEDRAHGFGLGSPAT